MKHRSPAGKNSPPHRRTRRPVMLPGAYVPNASCVEGEVSRTRCFGQRRVTNI